MCRGLNPSTIHDVPLGRAPPRAYRYICTRVFCSWGYAAPACTRSPSKISTSLAERVTSIATPSAPASMRRVPSRSAQRTPLGLRLTPSRSAGGMSACHPCCKQPISLCSAVVGPSSWLASAPSSRRCCARRAAYVSVGFSNAWCRSSSGLKMLLPPSASVSSRLCSVGSMGSLRGSTRQVGSPWGRFGGGTSSNSESPTSRAPAFPVVPRSAGCCVPDRHPPPSWDLD